MEEGFEEGLSTRSKVKWTVLILLLPVVVIALLLTPAVVSTYQRFGEAERLVAEPGLTLDRVEEVLKRSGQRWSHEEIQRDEVRYQEWCGLSTVPGQSLVRMGFEGLPFYYDVCLVVEDATGRVVQGKAKKLGGD